MLGGGSLIKLEQHGNKFGSYLEGSVGEGGS